MLQSRDVLNSVVQLLNFYGIMHVIFSVGLALFIHWIMSAKRTHEIWLVVLVGEGSTQLLKYSLETSNRYCTYLTIFNSQKRSIEALNFLIITP